jgi:ribonuclease PH
MLCEKMRKDNRTNDNMRDITFEVNYIKNPHGSCLVKVGNTWVLCTASIEDKVPPFLRNTGKGWITAEYSMLPGSTSERVMREIVKGKQSGRTLEIQRLISRALRSSVNLELLGERMITIDCDVLQADGGTRTAAINGGYVALQIALRSLNKRGLLHRLPFMRHIAAISCGIVNGEVLLDLDYLEDSSADVDANFICGSDGSFIEVQFTAEKNTFSQDTMLLMLDRAKSACTNIIDKAKDAILSAVGEV